MQPDNKAKTAQELYINLIKAVLIDLHRIDLAEFIPINDAKGNWKFNLLKQFNAYLNKKNIYICTNQKFDRAKRLVGKDRPRYADSMIGLKRLDNIEFCFKKVINNNIKGDFIETGVWRGGATIFMKALLDAFNIKNRRVWVADSFEGLPKPNVEKYEADKGDIHYTKKDLAITLEQVKGNFAKYGLLDDNVVFLKGWFKDTLPNAQVDKIAIMRLDGDMYESTMDALKSLYHKLSVGGYVIIDDYGALDSCKQAVLDFRRNNEIKDEIMEIDWTGAYWQKS